MSVTIDERVVSMQFDNKRFEKNVSQTMSTLDKLKQSLNLNGVAKGFEELNTSAHKVDMSVLSNGVEAIKVKFSAMEVMAITALTNITNRAISAGEKLVKSLSIDQITAGWSKYEQKTSSIQTILNSTGKSMSEVEGYLNKLMWFSDETSYGFTDMTSGLATMVSSGGDIEKLIPLITGVANATAFAGKGAAEFSRVLQYGVNQAYSLGYMQTQDWKTIEGATVNSKQLMEALIKAGEALGKIKKGSVTVENFRTSLSKKWLDKDVMEAGFGAFSEFSDAVYSMVQSGEVDQASDAIAKLSGKYSDVGEKAFKSAQEAKSFREAIDATKDAVSSGWMRTFEIIFGDYEEAKLLWTSVANGLWEAFASGAESRNELLKGVLSSKWGEFNNQITYAGVSVDTFTEKLKQVSTEGGLAIEDLINEHGTLRKVIDKGLISADIFKKTIDDMVGSEEDAIESLNKLNSKVLDFEEIIRKVLRGEFGDVESGYEGLAKAGYDVAEVQKLINNSWVDGKLDLTTMTEAQLINMGYTKEQAKELQTLAYRIGSARISMYDLAESMTRPTGRELILESLAHILTQIQKPITAIKDAWLKIFPKKTEDQLYTYIEKFSELASNFTITQEQADNFRKVFEGLFAGLEASNWVITGSLSTSLRLLNNVLKLFGTDIFTVAGIVADYLIIFRDWVKEHTIFIGMADKVSKVIYTMIIGVHDCIQAFLGLNSVNKVFNNLGGSIGKLFGVVSDGFESINIDLFCTKLAEAFDLIENWIKGMDSSGVIGTLVNIVNWLVNSVTSAISYIIKDANLFGSIVDGITKFISNTIDKLKEFKKESSDVLDTSQYTGFLRIVEGVLDLIVLVAKKIGECLTAITKGIGDAFGTDLLEIVNAGLFGGIILTLNRFLTKKKGATLAGQLKEGILGGFKEAFKEFKDSFSGIIKTLDSVREALKTWQQSLQAGTIMKIATAVAILAGSLLVLSVIPADNLSKSLAGVTVLLTELMIALTVFSKLKFAAVKDVTKSLVIMIGIALSMLLLASAIAAISDVDFGKVLTGLVAVGVLMAEMSIFLKKYEFKGKLKGAALGMVLLSSAVLILTSAVERLGKLELNQLGNGLVGVGAIIAAFGAFTKFTSGATKMVGVGVGMLAIAASLRIIVPVLETLSALDHLDLIKSVGVIAATLLTLAFALNSMPYDALLTSSSLVIAVASLKLLASSLSDFVTMTKDWTGVGRGLTAMCIALAEIVIALNLMKGTMGASASLIIAASALSIIGSVISKLGTMTIGGAITSLGLLAGAFVVIGVAGKLLAPMIPTLLGLAGAFALFGVSILGIGAGLALIGVGISSIAASLVVHSASIVGSLTLIIGGVLDLIPLILTKIGEGIVAFAVLIGENAPLLVSSVLQMFLGILIAIDEYETKIIEAGVNIILDLIYGLIKYVPKLVEAAIILITSFIEGLAEAIDNNSERISGAIIRLLYSIVKLIVELLTSALSAIKEKGEEISSAIAKGISNKVSEVRQGINILVEKAKEAISEKVESFKEAGKEVISGFIEGIRNKISLVGSVASEIGKKALNSIKSFLGIASPSKEFIEVGKYSSEGLVVGLKKYAGKVSAAAEQVGNSALNPIQSAISDIINSDIDTQPTIRPVIDLSDVERGAGAINGMLGMSPSMGVLANVGGISSMMNNRIQNGTDSNIISAIKDLKESLKNKPSNTYNVNGITYDDGSNISSAVQAIVRAAVVERRK